MEYSQGKLLERLAAEVTESPDGWRKIETHISVILLTGEDAYKFKKPLQLGFLDYSTLEKRRENCLKELEINRRFSEQLYLNLVAVIETDKQLRFVDAQQVADSDDVLEYGVRMKQFPADSLLHDRLKAGLPTVAMDQLADVLAELHSRLPVTRFSADQFHEATKRWAKENFQYLRNHLVDFNTCQTLEQWTDQFWQDHQGIMAKRFQSGHVRRCHGDLHLENVLFWDEQFQLFDGIEFNDELSEIDVANDLAFLLMELSEHGYRSHARRLLSRYLERSQDYELIGVLRYYLVYRALVRAKVDLIRQQQTSQQERSRFSAAGKNYQEFAERIVEDGDPTLYLMHGVSGSGKSTVAMRMVEHLGVVRLRSDWVRKFQHDQSDPYQKTSVTELSRLYSQEATDKTYQWLLEQAALLLANGFSVAVDATFLSVAQRSPFQKLAESLGIDYRLVACHASRAELVRRLRERGSDPSDATVEVLDRQLHSHEPLLEAEASMVVTPEQLFSVDF